MTLVAPLSTSRKDARESRKDAREPREDTRVPRRVWTGTAALVAVRLVGTLASFCALALLARTLEGAVFGRLTFYLAVLLFLESFVDCGTSSAAVQRGAHDARVLAGAITAGRRVRAVAALAGATAVTGLAAAFGEPDLAYVALATLLPLTRSLELSAVVYHAQIRWRVPALVRAATAVLRLALALALWRAGVASFGPYLLAHAAAGALGNVVLHLSAKGKLEPGATPLTGFLALALPLAVVGIAQQAYFYADNLVVRGLAGDVELGRYNAAMRLFAFLVLVAGLATTTALPWLTRRARAGDLGRSTTRLALPLLALTLPVALALMPLADEILVLLFGAEFAGAAPSLRWLLAAAAVVSVGAGCLTAVLAAGRIRALVAIVLGGLVLNVGGNLWLVPELGIEGAAVATFATELFVALAAAGVVLAPRRESGARPR